MAQDDDAKVRPRLLDRAELTDAINALAPIDLKGQSGGVAWDCRGVPGLVQWDYDPETDFHSVAIVASAEGTPLGAIAVVLRKVGTSDTFVATRRPHTLIIERVPAGKFRVVVVTTPTEQSEIDNALAKLTLSRWVDSQIPFELLDGMCVRYPFNDLTITAKVRMTADVSLGHPRFDIRLKISTVLLRPELHGERVALVGRSSTIAVRPGSLIRTATGYKATFRDLPPGRYAFRLPRLSARLPATPEPPAEFRAAVGMRGDPIGGDVPVRIEPDGETVRVDLGPDGAGVWMCATYEETAHRPRSVGDVHGMRVERSDASSSWFGTCRLGKRLCIRLKTGEVRLEMYNIDV